ncbi:MAG: hypothetical protein AAGL34_19670, partial [Bacteroidota bacterium]
MKKINFFRDAQRVAPKLCILSKNFIEQKSFRIKKYPLNPLKNAKKAILKFFDFLRDAAHVSRKRCILSKNFIEQKSLFYTFLSGSRGYFWILKLFCSIKFFNKM